MHAATQDTALGSCCERECEERLKESQNEKANTHPDIGEWPIGTLSAIDEKPTTTASKPMTSSSARLGRRKDAKTH